MLTPLLVEKTRADLEDSEAEVDQFESEKSNLWGANFNFDGAPSGIGWVSRTLLNFT
jgi:hypothetical protein